MTATDSRFEVVWWWGHWYVVHTTASGLMIDRLGPFKWYTEAAMVARGEQQ